MMYLKALKTAGLLFFCLLLTRAATAQSSRPGWGSTPYSGGVTFRVWAPNATSVFVPGQFNSWSTNANPLAKELTNGVWQGVWSGDITTASTGQQYKYYIVSTNGSVWKHDPRSRLCTYSGSSSGANDIIYDPAEFNWKGDSITPPSISNLFVYEMHAGTFNTNGSTIKFIAATNKLDYLKNLGVNAVEVMPIAEFPGNSSWGYNLAQPFAVENVGYGGADSFKTFVHACHLRGIAVFLDVVHNHYGPSDLDMWNFDGWVGSGSIGGGIYFWESNTNLEETPYGNTRPNYDSLQVSNYIQDNFTMWLSECHVDGFRWDTPGLMMNVTGYGTWNAAQNLITTINSMIHSSYTGKISIAEDVYNSYGFDSAWDTTYPYTLTPQLTNTVDADRDMSTIANCVQYNQRYGGNAGTGRVAFLESHDVVGDLNGGVRLVTAIDPSTPNSYRARKLSTLGSGVTFTSPGVPMMFQGQEMLENQSFDSSLPVDWTKTNTYSYIVKFYTDLISCRRDLKGYTPGLLGDQVNVMIADSSTKLLAFRRWKSAAVNQQALIVANFSGVTISNYSLSFPYGGNWYAHLNSDLTQYGPDYGNNGSTVVNATGVQSQANVTVGPYSILIFSQTPDAPPQVKASVTNHLVNVSWPSSYFEWVLYTSPGVGTNAAWVKVPPSQYQTNGATVSVNLTPSSGPVFYRLQKM